MTKSQIEIQSDILRKYGKLCNENACESCPLSVFGVSCQDALEKHTEEAISIIESNYGNDSYLAEYRRRFPFNKANDDSIIFGICRKELFEGAIGMSVSCPTKDCKSCWLKSRLNDIEDEDDYTSGVDISGNY